jgi:hypothetical protein
LAERAGRAVEQQPAASHAYVRAYIRAYIRSVAADAEAVQLAKARGLLQSGAIIPDEFRRMVPSVHS